MKKLNETAPEIMPKNNIVVIQCLFRNMLTDKQMNLKSQIITSKLRRGLDFEMYYHLNGDVVKKLLDSTLLATNCKNWRRLYNKDQIIDILEPYQPFACFLTDSYGNQIVGDEMSPESQDILRRRSAQNTNFSIFRFSFLYTGYSAAMRSMLYWKDTNQLVDNEKYIQLVKNGKIVGIYNKDDNTDRHDKTEIGQIFPFITSGYWSGFKFDPNAPGWEGRVGEFVKNSDIAEPFIPALVGGQWHNDQTSMFKSIVTGPGSLDNSKLIQFLEKAASTAVMSGNDLRTKTTESVWIENVAHMLDESMLEK